MEEEKLHVTDVDVEEVEAEDGYPRVMVEPHEIGGIKVTVRGADGTVTSARVDIGEAALVATHLQALITMAFGTVYAQQAAMARAAAQGQQQGGQIIVPGGR